jgi:hypothetical protein
VTQAIPSGGQDVVESLGIDVAYQPSTKRATLLLSGGSDFTQGGEIVVNAAPSSGLTGTSRVYLDRHKKGGVPGGDGLFTILRKTRRILPQSRHHRGLD